MNARKTPAPSVNEYGRLLSSCDNELFEPQAFYQAEGHWSERHLQCVWYNDKLRPKNLTTRDGEPVEVLSPGRWNLEAGPDFLDASLLVGTERRRIEGDVELHVRPSAWTQHGHADDPRYANVAAHLTYFPGPHPSDLPSRVLEISLRDLLLATPRFSFDDIDLSAYPHALLPTTPRPCQTVWGNDPDKGISILMSAGRFRFERKRKRMESLIAKAGNPVQALYEGVMTALGYKRNASPFRLLAKSYPISDWVKQDPFFNYAILLGLGGLLPHDEAPAQGNEQQFARLWHIWWRNPRPLPEPAIEWHLDATRPNNHPKRRLAAAASLFSRTDEWMDILSKTDLGSPALAKNLGKLLRRFSTWPGTEGTSGHSSDGARTTSCLLGDSRAAVIVNNALMPFLAATRPDATDGISENLRPETISSTMKIMANRLFGRDHNPVVLYGRSGLAQQGLLQIYSDFCLNSRNNCLDCAFGKNDR